MKSQKKYDVQLVITQRTAINMKEIKYKVFIFDF